MYSWVCICILSCPLSLNFVSYLLNVPGKNRELRNLVSREIVTFGGNFYLKNKEMQGNLAKLEGNYDWVPRKKAHFFQPCLSKLKRNVPVFLHANILVTYIC